MFINTESMFMHNDDLSTSGALFMQHLFYSCVCDLHMKVSASMVSCRPGDNSGTFQTLDMTTAV